MHLSLSGLLLFTLTGPLIAQKKDLRLKFEYYSQDNMVSLVTKATTRVGRKYESINGLDVDLFLNEETPTNQLGKVTTDENGEGTFVPSEKFYTALDTLNQFTMIARVVNHNDFKDKRTELTIQRGDLTMTLLDMDTVKYIMARVQYLTDSGKVPVSQLQVKFFVKRLFSLLPIGGDYNFTNEGGEVRMAFPDNIPGDGQGRVEIVSKIIDHESLGNISISKSATWGTVPAETNFLQKRTMWSPRNKAPLVLMIVPNVLLALAWGFMVYLVYLLYKINQQGILNK